MPAKTLNGFKADLMAFSDQLNIGIGQARRRVALEMFQKITQRTPRDTGRAAAAWNLSDGAPNPAVPPEGKDAYALPSPAPISDRPFEVTFVANALPYIERLEFEGWSKQAPNGFARIVIAETEAEVQALMKKTTA
jgi:hypothetical protein